MVKAVDAKPSARSQETNLKPYLYELRWSNGWVGATSYSVWEAFAEGKAPLTIRRYGKTLHLAGCS